MDTIGIDVWEGASRDAPIFGLKSNSVSNAKKQGRIHNHISRERWAGALMEVRSLFGLTRDGQTTDARTDGRTDIT